MSWPAGQGRAQHGGNHSLRHSVELTCDQMATGARAAIGTSIVWQALVPLCCGCYGIHRWGPTTVSRHAGGNCSKSEGASNLLMAPHGSCRTPLVDSHSTCCHRLPLITCSRSVDTSWPPSSSGQADQMVLLPAAGDQRALPDLPDATKRQLPSGSARSLTTSLGPMQCMNQSPSAQPRSSTM